MQIAGILSISLIVALILRWPRVANAKLWRATITPLASIIGSGFLVLGPILAKAYGLWTPLAMALLCLVAYAIGASVRFNILALERSGHGALTSRIEAAASWVLSFAYIISVAYYLNLLGAFAVSLTPWDTELAARGVTSAVFIGILSVGWSKGFAAMERMEQISVGLKLSIIAGLLFGLLWFFANQTVNDALIFTPASTTGWSGITLLFGLLVTVQGFETSRYLGEDYSAATRVRSMRLAQILSAGIYMIYVVLMSYVFAPAQIETSETAIIDLMVLVSPVLPVMLIIAALAAQFSAAVADTSSAGGLMSELTKGRFPVKVGYAVLTGLGLVLTWGMDVFEIISWASKAFAAYYMLQAAIAVCLARREQQSWHIVAFFSVVTLFAACVMVFGAAVE
jgi:hypothetical protein